MPDNFTAPVTTSYSSEKKIFGGGILTREQARTLALLPPDERKEQMEELIITDAENHILDFDGNIHAYFDNPEAYRQEFLELALLKEKSATFGTATFTEDLQWNEDIKVLNQTATEIIDEHYLRLYESARDKFDIVYSQLEGFILSNKNGVKPQQAADPVNLFNGNFLYSVTDFQIDGAGIRLSFTRAYAQLASYNGPLGFKWDHSYNLWLQVVNDRKDIFVSNGNLSKHHYKKHQLYDYWIPPYGSDAVLLVHGDSFVLKNPGGEAIIFKTHLTSLSQIHIVDRIEDRFGNYLQFFYDDNLLSSIEINHPERWISFAYDTLNRITSVKDFTDRKWTYYYDDAGDLAAVRNPATMEFKSGTVTQYEYSTSSFSDPQTQHNLTTIIDGDGKIYLENEYGTGKNLLSYNRIIRQRQGNGDTLFDYADVVENFNASYHRNEQPAFQSIVTERDGRQVKYLFNHYGNMILREEYARINGLLKLVTFHYRYNKDGNLIGTISPLGVVQQYLYARDYYEKKFPQDNDYSRESDHNLTQNVRQGFNALLSIVKRQGYYTIDSLNLSRGLWAADIFPDIYDTNDGDIIQKFSYETDFLQLLTSSDPRFTKSSNPDILETDEYKTHLTRYLYKSGNGFEHFYLSAIHYPTPILPDGNISSPAVLTLEEYDTKGRILKQVAPNGLEILKTYYSDEDGLLTGFEKSVEYVSEGLSKKTEYERDALGRITGRYSPKYFEYLDERFFSTIEYNVLDQVTKSVSTAPFQISTQHIYNRTGNIARSSVELKDGENIHAGFYETLIKYDEEFHPYSEIAGNIHSNITKRNRTIYDRSGRPYISIHSSGYKCKLMYNERGMLWQRINDYGSVHAKTKSYFDADGRVVKMVDALGNTSRIIYDAIGRPVENDDAKGNKLVRHYDKLGSVITEMFFEKISESKYSLISRRAFTYDALGRKIRAVENLFDLAIFVNADALHSTFVEIGPGIELINQFFYDSMNNIFKVIDASGKIYLTDFDVLGRVTKKVDPLNNETVYQYDIENNITRVDRKEVVKHDVSEEISGYQYFSESRLYDELNRLIEKTDNLGSKTKYCYDSRNNLLQITDPLNNLTEFQYDIFSRVIKRTQYLHQYVTGENKAVVNSRWNYNDFDKIADQVDPLERLTRFSYDTLGRQISTILPDGSADQILYDVNNNIVSYTDRAGLIQRFSYDELNRNIALVIDATRLQEPDSFSGSVNFFTSYDGIGRVVKAENDHCITRFQFNSVGWNVKEENSFKIVDGAEVPGVYTIERAFNNGGFQKELTYPSKRKLNFERDSIDRLVTISQAQRGDHFPGDISLPENYVVATIHYEGLRKKQISRINGTYTSYSYDFGGRLAEIKHSLEDLPFLQMQFLYDGMGNMKQQAAIASDFAQTQVYHHDSFSRLINVKAKRVNRLSDLSVIQPLQFPVPPIIPYYQEQIDALIYPDDSDLTGSYNYDLVGNRQNTIINDAEQHYDSNSLDQYEKINDQLYVYDRNGNLKSEESTTYAYNHRNQLSRVKKNGNSAIIHLYDALGRRCIQQEDEIYSLMIYDGFNLLEEYENGRLKSSLVNEEGQDNLLQQSKGGAEFYFYPDLIKSVRYLLKGREKYNYYQYDDFGNLTDTSIDNDGNLFGFAGKRKLIGINMYDFIFRSYNPSTGKFIQRDPKGFVDGSNLYSYVGNKPLTFIDPYGTTERKEKNMNLPPVGDFTDVLGAGLSKISDFLKQGFDSEMDRLAFLGKRISELIGDEANRYTINPLSFKQYSDEARSLRSVELNFPKLLHLFESASKAVDLLGAGFTFYEKAFGGKSKSDSFGFKLLDGAVSGMGDFSFGAKHPIVAGVDAASGFIQEKALGGKYVSIGESMSVGYSNLTGVLEAIVTGDASSLERLQADANKPISEGGMTAIPRGFWNLGEFFSENGGKENALLFGKTVERLFGEGKSSRAAAFIGAVPSVWGPTPASFFSSDQIRLLID